MKRMLVAIIGIFLATPPDMAAQTAIVIEASEDERQILRLVAEKIESGKIGGGSKGSSVVLAPGVARNMFREASVVARRWSPELLRDLAGVLNARVADGADVYSCEGHVPECTLQGADLLVVLGAPEIDGGAGVVPVTMVEAPWAPERTVAYRTDMVLKLEREGSEWRIIEPEVIRVQ